MSSSCSSARLCLPPSRRSSRSEPRLNRSTGAGRRCTGPGLEHGPAAHPPRLRPLPDRRGTSCSGRRCRPISSWPPGSELALPRARELVGEIVRCGLDVIPENDPKDLCPNLGGCGAFRRALATRLLDARVNFGEWRIQRTALDARLRAMKLESRNFEGLTNVGHDYAGRRERDDQGCRRGGPRVQSAKCRPLVAHGERQRYGERGRKPEMTD